MVAMSVVAMGVVAMGVSVVAMGVIVCGLPEWLPHPCLARGLRATEGSGVLRAHFFIILWGLKAQKACFR